MNKESSKQLKFCGTSSTSMFSYTQCCRLDNFLAKSFKLHMVTSFLSKVTSETQFPFSVSIWCCLELLPHPKVVAVK